MQSTSETNNGQNQEQNENDFICLGKRVIPLVFGYGDLIVQAGSLKGRKSGERIGLVSIRPAKEEHPVGEVPVDSADYTAESVQDGDIVMFFPTLTHGLRVFDALTGKLNTIEDIEKYVQELARK